MHRVQDTNGGDCAGKCGVCFNLTISKGTSKQLLCVIRALLPVQQAFFESFHTELAPFRLRLLSFPPGPWDPRVFAKSRKSVQCGPISKMNGTEMYTT